MAKNVPRRRRMGTASNPATSAQQAAPAAAPRATRGSIGSVEKLVSIKPGGEGADADERRMAETAIAGEAAQDVPCQCQAGGIQHQLSDAHIERRHEQGAGREQGDAQRRRG